MESQARMTSKRRMLVAGTDGGKEMMKQLLTIVLLSMHSTEVAFKQ